LSDNKNEDNLEVKSKIDGSYHDLENDDGHIKAKTAKQIEYEKKQEKRKQDAMLAHAKSDEGLKSDSLKKQKYERKELSKQEGADLEKELELEKEPEIHIEERDRNEHNYIQQQKSPIKIQGIDAETEDLMRTKKKPHANTSVAIEDAGSPALMRSPSKTPDARKEIEKGIFK
jgi:hypothetical protein